MNSSTLKTDIKEKVIQRLHMTIFASLSKETLKYGSACNAQNSTHKLEKLLLKDLVKSLSNAAKASEWVQSEIVRIFNSIFFD